MVPSETAVAYRAGRHVLLLLAMLFMLVRSQGLGKSCLYCGDGINDLAALAAADVGMALGSAEASAAATLTDCHYSVAGQAPGCLLILCTTWPS